ncbi:hypothetical protein [Haloechinothrix sp. LS1_15]|uniref:hypothetical protein n=1 Tax=Haloechinothrix sp. LS1_15 TaxID=2652248 RepID=UPI0029447B86|nr:hypothetical protein [Haloechinothrix sp. LS1_15]MDV6013291.1 hypothetical protein [Haloechinothrix sp. LS1_15]
MSGQRPRPSDYLDAMDAARRRLDATADAAATDLRKADELLAKEARNDTPPTAEEIERFKEYVTGPGYAPQWDVVIRRIEAGELSWSDVLTGAATNDSDVRAAFQALPQPAPLAEEAGAATTPAGSRPPTDDHDEDDDDYFANFSIGRKP